MHDIVDVRVLNGLSNSNHPSLSGHTADYWSKNLGSDQSKKT